MSAVRDDRSDTFDITAWVLRHHISGRRFFRTPAMAYTPHLAFWQLITYCTLTSAAHIQEHKFTLSLAALGRRPGARITNDSPWQLLHIGAPVPRSVDHDGDELRLAEWVLNCLVAVRQHWDAVVDEGERVVARKGAAVRVEPGGEMDVVMALRRWRGYVERTKGAMEGVAALTGEQLPAEWEERWACRVGFEFGALERRVGALIVRVERERAAASAAAAAVQAEWAPAVEQVVAAENNIAVFTISFLPVMAVLIMISCGLLPACITAGSFLVCFVSIFSAAGFFCSR
ncbi:hypothetical protein DFP73DRAFT_569334 [Morchella snyderi]|nr:hypothetical protein DFP73DRAFT_569334 [Morchella snyderi]